MELKWLEDFIALARCGSFSRAAEVRFISQPAFSRRIKALEDWLGGSLFDRGTLPLTLTRQGEDFFLTAQTLVQQIHQARASFQSYLVPKESEIHLGAGPGLLSPVVFDLLQTHLMQFPRVRFCLDDSTGNPSEDFESLIRGQYDLILQYAPVGTQARLAGPSHLQSKRIGKEEFVLVEAPGTLTHLPLISYPHASGLWQILAGHLRPIQKRYPSGAEVSCPFAALNLVIRALGMAVLPISLAQSYLDQGRLQISSLEFDSITSEIRLYRKGAFLGSHLEALWSSLPESDL